jgi:hypothetical protein
MRRALPTAGRDVRPVDAFGFSWIGPIWLRKPKFMRVGIPWISLDSLVRIETYQWVVRDFPRRFFREPFLAREAPERDPAVEAIRNGLRLFMGASLLQFLIVSNQLSSDPVGCAEIALLILTLAVRLLFKAAPRIGCAASPLCCSLGR